MNYQSIISLLIILTSIFRFEITNAQFKKKYKSRTHLNIPQNNDKKNTNQNVPEVISAQKLFGRDTGIKNSRSTNKKSTFVDLNPETAFGPEVIENFDFPNTDVLELTQHMQKLTGLNLILDKNIKGKVSISAPTPITVGDAWKAYLSVLHMNGYGLVKTGAFYNIIQSRDIRYNPTKIYTGKYTPDTENYVMKVIPLKNVDSAEITRSFRPFMTRYGRIIDIKQTNTIIVHDTGSNINRLMKLIKFLDVPGHEETLQIIKVTNSSAPEIASLLDKILKGQGSQRFRSGSGGKGADDISKLIAEPRTNTIIAMANAQGAKQLRDLVAKLDVKLTTTRSGQIHVYYLNYGDAETLSKTLSSLVSVAQKTSGPSASAANGQANLFSSQVKITADKANNALVVMASPTDYITIKRIISKLDIPRDQVYVEGLIMETNVNSRNEFGISIIGAYGTGGAQKFGSTPGSGGSDLINLLTDNVTSLGSLFYGVGLGKKITRNIGGTEVSINSVNGLIKAVASDSQTNILATPQVLALDNEEAVFEVGETVPTLVRETAANGSSITSVKEQKVALTLKITPQINKVSRIVKLKINQKIDDFSGRNTGADSGVGTTTRQAVTTVLIRDRDTIAMGGLMRDKTIDAENKVPLLGDIPVLGWLFKQKQKSIEKVNLLFFLTPKILAPYNKTAAGTMKDLINRRNVHLKKVYEDNDPFRTTVKGLYDKAKKQEEGPLFDQEASSQYLMQNEFGGLMPNKNKNLNTSANKNNTPNYTEIIKEAKKEKEKEINTPFEEPEADNLEDDIEDENYDEDSTENTFEEDEAPLPEELEKEVTKIKSPDDNPSEKVIDLTSY